MPTLHLAAFSIGKALMSRGSNVLIGSSSSNQLFNTHHRVQCMAAIKTPDGQINIVRRSGNYQPPIWSNDYIESLASDYVGESYKKRVEKMKERVRMMMILDHKMGMEYPLLHQLELIDTLQRLGLSYHFQDEIKTILNNIYNNHHHHQQQKEESNLHTIALEFRLLRQHGFHVAQGIFSRLFMDENGMFKSCICDNDCEGILSLYEAAHLLVDGESILLEAINFTTTYLKEYVAKHNEDEYLSTLVNHALEIPVHWRMLRLEARWFIDVYERKNDMSPILLKFAKLDFNIVQATHQEDLKYSWAWWRNVGLGDNLSFARDRLMENFLWTVGVIFEPEFGYCRRMLTQVNALITTIDDVYDVYDTLNELELFTDAVDRWDMSE